MEERGPFRRPTSMSLQRTHLKPRWSSTGFSYQRYHITEGYPRRHPTGLNLRPLSTHYDVKNRSKHSPGTSKGAPGAAHCTVRKRENKPLSIMISQERKKASSRGLLAPETVARNQAIQQKRREIEEVYKQDCNTVGIVVKMLIDKDPSLEGLIQASLQENLREIGLRCVEAMKCFIQDYDSQHSSAATSLQ